MSTSNESSGKSESMAEKVYAIMRGERRPDDFEIPGYYERVHKVRKLPASHFIELQKSGLKVKTIAQMYRVSELKIRKILKSADINTIYVVYEIDDSPLRASRIYTAKKIVDSSGLEVDTSDIIDLVR